MRVITIIGTAACAITLAGCRPSPSDETTQQGKPRIVSLAPSLTEIVYAVGGGDSLVGRSSACDYPPEAASVPVVGGFGMPSIEQILAANPTLILETSLADASTGQKMEELGLNRQHIPCTTLDDVPAAMRTIARLAGTSDQGEERATALETEIKRLRHMASTNTSAPLVYVEIWCDPVMTAGKSSFISELVHLAGGRNIADSVERGYFQTADEWIIDQDPDVIICLYMGSDAPARNMVMKRAGWQSLTAIRNGHVYDSIDNDILLRPGPRVLEGIAQLRTIIKKAVPTP